MAEPGASDEERRAAQAAFELFVRRHSATLLRFCLGRLSDRHAAEDAAQEAMLRLQRQSLEGRHPEEPLSWALATARRCCQEAQRRRRRDAAQPLEEAEPASAPERSPELDVEHAVRQLSEAEQAVVYLKHTEGLRCRQIAETLGQPLGTVTAVLSRAYAKLRPRLLAEFET